MIKRLLLLITLLVIIVPGLGIAQAAPLAAKPGLAGTLVSETTNAGATTLLVSTKKQGQVSVTISSGTIFVRRYNGASALDELSLNDSLTISGAFATGSTTVFTAARVKDLSIQEAATRAVLIITTVNTATNTFTGTVLHEASSRATPFSVGATVTVTVSASGVPMTKIMMWSNGKLVPTTIANLQAGQKVTVLGVYNRKLHTYTQTRSVRIHP